MCVVIKASSYFVYRYSSFNPANNVSFRSSFWYTAVVLTLALGDRKYSSIRLFFLSYILATNCIFIVLSSVHCFTVIAVNTPSECQTVKEKRCGLSCQPTEFFVRIHLMKTYCNVTDCKESSYSSYSSSYYGWTGVKSHVFH